jgi:hypothetical protein
MRKIFGKSMRIFRFASAVLIALALLAIQSCTEDVPKPVAKASAFELVPPNKDNDLRIFYADGKIVKGPLRWKK